MYRPAVRALLLADREILLVRLFVPDSGKHIWLAPGGGIEPYEDHRSALIREVWEETGVKARFEAIATFRHWIDYRPNMSDIYIICRLTPLSHEITPQLSEIDRALWMPLDHYLNHPDASDPMQVINRTKLQCSRDNTCEDTDEPYSVVLNNIESVFAWGGTNVAAGMRAVSVHDQVLRE